MRTRSHTPVGLLHIEAMWWMTRPVSVTTAFIAIPGWLAAQSSPSNSRLVAMVGAVMAGRMAANVVNDLFDKDKDQITAPWLPLPSGLVTVRQAVFLVMFLAGCMLVMLFLAADSWARFSLGLGIILLASVVYSGYSFVKSFPAAAMSVTGFVYMCPPAIAWLIAGGGWSIEIAIVLIYALMRGLAANVFSNLRDVDRDADAGNRSIAVRLGAARALRFGLLLEGAAALVILGIAILRHHFLFGMLVVSASIGMLFVAYISTAEKIQRARDRVERTVLMRPVNLARNYVGIILVQSVPIGVGAALTTAVVRKICLAPYARRIPGGELRRDLLAAAMPDSGRAGVMESP